MTRIYQFASRFCGSAAVVCAMLALFLATSPSALADEPLTCEACCTGLGYTDPYGYQYLSCVSNCQQGYGECAANVTCGGKAANGCVGAEENLCSPQGTICPTVGGGGKCTCKWYSTAIPNSGYCGCYPRP